MENPINNTKNDNEATGGVKNSTNNHLKNKYKRKTFKTRKQKRLEKLNRKDDRDTRPQKQYADIVKKNKDFEFYYKNQNLIETEQEWNEFLEILQQPLPSSFRISSFCPGQAQKMRDIIQGDYLKQCFLENNNCNENNDEDDSEFKTMKNLDIHPIPWYPNKLAWTINLSKMEIRKSTALNKLHRFLISETETGDISRQEAVSMIPPLLLDIKAGQSVLDLCAAPGSKTAQIIEMLHQESSSTFLSKNNNNNNNILDGLVVANDVDNRRCYMLVHQSKRLHSPSVVVINHDAGTLPDLYQDNCKTLLKFDRVLADVPCSGDGTFRKNYDVWTKWNTGLGNNFHSLQLKILKRGVELLKKDGIIAYSTCSLNPIENEAVIASFLNSSKGDLELINAKELLPELKCRPGLETWKVMTKESKIINSYKDVPENLQSQIRETLFPPENVQDLNLKYCIRIMPHYQNTGGFFIALLRKKSDKMCWETTQQKQQNNSIDISNIKDQEENSNNKKQVPTNNKKKSRFQGHRENPFFFFKETEPDWIALKSYYQFPENFYSNQLAHRCPKGRRRNIYYLTEKAANFIKNNQHIKLISGGSRVFNRIDVKNLICLYRITQEGISTMFPYFITNLKKYSPCFNNNDNDTSSEEKKNNKFTISEFDFDHFISLLKKEDLKMEQLNEETRKIAEQISPGCCILYVHIKSSKPDNFKNSNGDNDNDEFKFILPICVWKGKNSLRAYVAKNDRLHLLRLCGQEPDESILAKISSNDNNLEENEEEEDEEKGNKRILDDDDDDDDDNGKDGKGDHEINDNHSTEKKGNKKLKED